MKLVLIGFLAVQITAVVCTYRRHGASSRNSASFLLRKVCVEVAGMKEKVVGLEQDNAALKEDVAGLEEKVIGLEKEITILKQPGNPYVTNDFYHLFHLDESIFIFRVVRKRF